MAWRSIVNSVLLVSLLLSTALSTGFAARETDPFAPYKDFLKKPLNIEPKELKYYQEEERLIRNKLALDISKRERVILAGLHWLITYIDNDDHFEFLFPDFMLLMNSLKNSENRIHQREVVTRIIKKSLAREIKNLKNLNVADDNSRSEFIRVMNIAYPYQDLHKSYLDFYSQHFGSRAKEPFLINGSDFRQALANDNYRDIFSYLLQTSFLHHYLKRPKVVSKEFPEDKFPSYIREIESYDFDKDLDVTSNKFRELGYLVTHIPLWLTNYGDFPLRASIIANKAKEYIDATLDKVRNQLGDFDLLAEYIQCLKMFNPDGSQKIKDLEQFLYDLQRPDGSWGSSRDFNTNPYTAIHPGGAALMALNQSKRRKRV